MMSFSLDEYQKNAVTTKEKNLLIISAPGSGKTTVIVNRVNYIVKELNVNPNNIVVITFTRSAAQNMKERYLNMTKDTNAPFFGTFHGLFYKICNRYYGNIKIIEQRDTYRIINNVLVKYLDEIGEEKVREVLNDISILKSSFINIEDFNPSMDKEIFKNCFESYENYKKEKGLWDFDDIQINTAQLFEKNEKILEGYRKLFKYMLVDEFQDCDDTQIHILKLLNKYNSIFAVGDEDQCIYSFRGSKPECMVDFSNTFKNGSKVYLSYNYRSTENIVETSKNLIEFNKMRNDKVIKSYRKDRKPIFNKQVLDEAFQSNDISQKISLYLEMEDCKYKDNAILYRTNLESRPLIDTFIRNKIPFVLLDKEYNFFEHFICKDMLAYLRLSIDPFNRQDFCRIINKPFRYISKVNLDKVRNYKFKDDCFCILKGIDGLAAFQAKAVDTLRKDVLWLNKLSLRSAIDFIITDLGYINYLREYSEKFKIKLSDLEEILEEFKNASEEYNSIILFLAHVENVKEELEKSKKVKNKDAVIMSTIHGVKGMEFKNVYIINCNDDIIPHVNSKKDSLEEERRLFYVAITRAIDNLFIYSTEYMRGQKRDISPFLKECKLQEERISIPYKKGDKIYHKAFKEGVITSVEGYELEIEFTDGIKRRFDFKVLYMNKLITKLN
ncbi:ATP-dependent helicase [Clostridium algidicarnis]|uniref:ATP-dependent helicase n=1 Tax=Clostridium algidicarnis TaxID=37659 RepID=UPI001C0C2F49|nr:ATP-dependent helicase [Clostridium algidicarnis]MBU3196121.1 ATP-dependent helicase [Clostridium algidicarnis]MBU3229000.1 ATP-dependent helicase [Clostridium algidicarnis]MBU3252581.1 ATP-dependent helicase [Clostridium algidicarnis]